MTGSCLVVQRVCECSVLTAWDRSKNVRFDVPNVSGLPRGQCLLGSWR